MAKMVTAQRRDRIISQAGRWTPIEMMANSDMRPYELLSGPKYVICCSRLHMFSEPLVVRTFRIGAIDGVQFKHPYC